MTLIHVFGRVGDGPVLYRAVTVRDFLRAWGPWSRAVLSGREYRPFRHGDKAVWVQIEQDR